MDDERDLRIVGENLIPEAWVRDVAVVKDATVGELPPAGREVVDDDWRDPGVQARRRDGAADESGAARDRDRRHRMGASFAGRPDAAASSTHQRVVSVPRASAAGSRTVSSSVSAAVTASAL